MHLFGLSFILVVLIQHNFGLGLALNNASSLGITIRLINICYESFAALFLILTIFLASNELIFDGLYFATSKISHQFYFEFACFL